MTALHAWEGSPNDLFAHMVQVRCDAISVSTAEAATTGHVGVPTIEKIKVAVNYALDQLEDYYKSTCILGYPVRLQGIRDGRVMVETVFVIDCFAMRQNMGAAAAMDDP